MSSKPPFVDVDRVWLWKDDHHYTQVATEQPPPHLPSAEFIRADYTWKQLQARATGDDGVDLEVLLRRQAKRIAELERENARLRKAPEVSGSLELDTEPQWLSDPERSEVIDVLGKVTSLTAGCLSDEEALEEAQDICERLQRHQASPSEDSPALLAYTTAMQAAGVPREPLQVYDSNSWRRVGLARAYKEVMTPSVDHDGHPNIAGADVLAALVAAFNAMLERQS